MAGSTKTRAHSAVRDGSKSRGRQTGNDQTANRSAVARSTAGSPFPARFANRPRSHGNGPHPGELLDFKKPTGNASIDLSDYFPTQSINAISAHGSISFHALGDSGVGTPEQHDVADAMS